MQNRLKACSLYLKEVEGKPIHLRNAIGDDLEAKSKVIEALDLIEQAHTAVSKTQQRVGELQRASNGTPERRSA